MVTIDLRWRYDRLMRAVDLAARALRKGHPAAAENALILLEVARDEGTRTEDKG